MEYRKDLLRMATFTLINKQEKKIKRINARENLSHVVFYIINKNLLILECTTIITDTEKKRN